MQWSSSISCFNLNTCNFQACNLTIKIWKSQKFWQSTRNFNLVKHGQLSADHNTYWGRWGGKAPRSKIAASSRSLVAPQSCQSLCVTPRQSWGSHPRHHQARQTNLRYFRQNKPKKQSKTHSRPQEPNCASTGKTGPGLTPCLPLTHTHKSSQLKSPVFGSQGYLDADPEHTSVAGAQKERGKLQGLSLHPHPKLVHLQAQMWPFLGRENCIWKEWNCSGTWGDAKCTVSPLNKPLHFLSLGARKSHCISGLIFLLLRPSKVGYCYILVSDVRVFHNKSDIVFMSNYLDALHGLYTVGTSFLPSSVLAHFLSSPFHTEVYK